MQGLRHQGQWKMWEPVLRLCIISAPLAMNPQSAHKCLLSEGLNGRRVDVREYKASGNFDHSIEPSVLKMVTGILINIKHSVKLGGHL